MNETEKYITRLEVAFLMAWGNVNGDGRDAMDSKDVMVLDELAEKVEAEILRRHDERKNKPPHVKFLSSEPDPANSA